jgi:quinol monooxygenase YgiN
MLLKTFTLKVLPLPIFKSKIGFESLIDGRVLRAPGVLESAIKLENALPVAGFLVRSDNTDNDEHRDEYMSCGKFRVKSGSIDPVLATIKDETALLLSSEPDVLSFFVLHSLDEADTILIWARFASQAAFDECSSKGHGYAQVLEKIKTLAEIDTDGMIGYTVVGGYLSNEKR